MKLTLDNTKTIVEIVAFLAGAVFLVVKLVGGQANAGMDVAVELERAQIADSPDQDHLKIVLRLKRADLGRLELDDVAIELSNAADSAARPVVLRMVDVMMERQVNKGRILPAMSNLGLRLPPSDGTQIAFLAKVRRGVPILVDATIVATRTGIWVGNPQWRASSIALPVEASSASASAVPKK